MSAPPAVASAALARETATFARYLVGTPATPYVAAQYAAAHHVRAGLAAANRFDRWLVMVARVHWSATFIVDAFVRFFAPRALVRRKLVLLLAILEVTPGLHTRIDSGWGPWFPALVVLAARGVLLAGALALGVLVLVPLRVIAATGRADD